MDRLIAHLRKQGQNLTESQTEPVTPAKQVPGEDTHAGSTQPLDMVKVPKGPFLYGDQKTRVVIDHGYWIDLYPVTNQKYGEFVLTGGYAQQKYWAPEGWQWKRARALPARNIGMTGHGNKPDHPVVGVSYYEVEAYAKWAGKRLPTEQEWEKSARGEDGRQYPWGEAFDKTRCNSDDSSIEHTTPVTQYSNGTSPYGCYDMAGNVWEWCTRGYDEHRKDTRVIRGGSWSGRPGMLCVFYRDLHDPGNRFNDIGFRLAQDMEP
ncbi:MAG: formylglycine-generating enzyme family protein [Nitrospira sp.]|nr:formylglycine-generating enzyme family protein [Nitrospira sp.]